MLKGVARRVRARCFLLPLCLVIAVGLGQEVIDSVDVGGPNVAGLTFNAKAGVVYGRCLYGENFFALDCSTNQVLAQIPLWEPNDVAYSATSDKAYCTFFSYGEDSILVVDGSTQSRLYALPMPGATSVIWDSVSDHLYVNCYVEDHVVVLDCQSDSVITRIPIDEPVAQTINTRWHKLYVHNDLDGSVAVIDMVTNQVSRTIHPGSNWYASCYSEVADKYFCSGPPEGEGVAVIDGAGDSVIKQIRLPQGYSAEAMMAVDLESLVMVAAYGSGYDTVYTLDARRDSIVSSLVVGRNPAALAFSLASGVVYCANSSSHSLTVIAADGTQVLSEVQVSDYPQNLLVVPAFEKLYVGHSGETNMLYIVRDRVGISESGQTRLTPPAIPAATLVGGRAFRYEGLGPASLVDACGREVHNIAVGNNDLSTLSPGVYVLVARPGVAPRKVVKLR